MAGPAATPPAATLLKAFVNTYDVQDGTDEVGTAEALGTWLHAHGLLSEPGPVTAAQLEVARELREALREELLAHHDLGAAPAAAGAADLARTSLDRIAATLPLRVSFTGEAPRLEAAGQGVDAALARLLVAVEDTAARGDWTRLKVCPDDTCRVAFYDTTKNRSRTWCSMGVCGNRAKARAYRARQARQERPS